VAGCHLERHAERSNQRHSHIGSPHERRDHGRVCASRNSPAYHRNEEHEYRETLGISQFAISKNQSTIGSLRSAVRGSSVASWERPIANDGQELSSI